MSDVIACPSCGTSNPADADWCNLCFAKFDSHSDGDSGRLAENARWSLSMMSDLARPLGEDTAPSDGGPTAPTSRERSSGGIDGAATDGPGEQLSFIPDDSKTWHCRFCDADVAIEATTCPVCQQSIYDSFGQTDEAPRVDPGVALRWAALPGGGHLKLGQGVLGVAIGLDVIISMVFGGIVVSSGRTLYGAGLVFIALSTWLASVHDVFRMSNNQSDEVLLRPRIVSVIAGLTFMIIVGAAVSTQPVIDQTTTGL